MNQQRRRSFFDGFREEPRRYLLRIATSGLVIVYGAYRIIQTLRGSVGPDRLGPLDLAFIAFGVVIAAVYIRRNWRQPKPPPVGPEAARRARLEMTGEVISISFGLVFAAGLPLLTLHVLRTIGSIFPESVPYLIAIGSGLTVWFSAMVVHSWRSHRAARRRYRVATGCCAACGYSLRGLPTPRCPECGTVSEHPPLPAAPPDPDEPRG